MILTKLDRLARSSTHLLAAIVEKLETKKVGRLKGVEYSLDQRQASIPVNTIGVVQLAFCVRSQAPSTLVAGKWAWIP